MSPLRRFDEINFYEELGVAPGASPEQIHTAFRALVRLLHPDQQTDVQLKQIAETQMRKLNAIYAVLSDPERRSQYDEDLREGVHERFARAIIVNAPHPSEFRRGGRLGWFAAALIGAAFLIWLAAASMSQPPAAFREEAVQTVPTPEFSAPRMEVQQGKNADADDSLSAENAELRADLKDATLQRDSALRELNRVRGATSPRLTFPALPAPPLPTVSKPNAPKIAVAELPPARRPAVQLAPLEATPTAPPAIPTRIDQTRIDPPRVDPPRTDPPRVDPPRVDAPASPVTPLAGIWVYVKPTGGQNPALKNGGPVTYPPEYIQTSITEENGALHGRYRSRFKIADRAISPDVNFTFTGAPNGSTLTCPWTGPGGARGRLTVSLTSENLLKVEWMATELGTLQGLASGSAILTRRIE